MATTSSSLEEITERLVNNDNNSSFITLEFELPAFQFIITSHEKKEGGRNTIIDESFLMGLQINQTVEEVTFKISSAHGDEFLPPEKELLDFDAENLYFLSVVLQMSKLHTINVIFEEEEEKHEVEDEDEENEKEEDNNRNYNISIHDNSTSGRSINTSVSSIGSSINNSCVMEPKQQQQQQKQHQQQQDDNDDDEETTYTMATAEETTISATICNTTDEEEAIRNNNDITHDDNDYDCNEKTSICSFKDLMTKNLSKALGLNSTLKRLKFYSPQGMDWNVLATNFLQVNDTVEELSLRQTNLGNDGCVAIARGLYQNNSVRHLDLSCNTIGNRGCEAIAKALQFNQTLQSLNLGINRIKNKGCKALSRVLSSSSANHRNNSRSSPERACNPKKNNNTSLVSLNLCGNRIENLGCVALARAVKTNTSLQILRLNINQISNHGCIAIVDAALNYNTTLTTLGLGSNYMDKKTCEGLALALSRMKNHHHKSTSSLTLLDVSFNRSTTAKRKQKAKHTPTKGGGSSSSPNSMRSTLSLSPSSIRESMSSSIRALEKEFNYNKHHHNHYNNHHQRRTQWLRNNNLDVSTHHHNDHNNNDNSPKSTTDRPNIMNHCRGIFEKMVL